MEEKLYLYYDSGRPCKENYSLLIEEGRIQAQLLCNSKKIYELRLNNQIDNSKSTVLLKNNYMLEKYCFIGWYAKKKVDEDWKWYCIDGSWRTLTELKQMPTIRRYYFSDGEMIGNLPLEKTDTKLIFEAQWQSEKSIEMKNRKRELRKLGKKLLNKVKKIKKGKF